jgi:hypothetical protein
MSPKIVHEELEKGSMRVMIWSQVPATTLSELTSRWNKD